MTVVDLRELGLPMYDHAIEAAGFKASVVAWKTLLKAHDGLLIASPEQAEAIIADGKADQVALARGFLDNPHWGWHAAAVLGTDVPRPPQYQRAAPKVWPGAARRG